MKRLIHPVIPVLAAGVCLAGCGGGSNVSTSSAASSSSATPVASATKGGPLLIGLNVPSTADPYIAGVITRGATLAVDQANASGGVKIGSQSYKLALRTYDDGGDPAKAAANVSTAISDRAIAMIEDGIGMASAAAKSTAAGIPEIDITDGDSGLLTSNAGPVPSLFGLRIPNNFAADVMATYMAARKYRRVAILHDDSNNGRDGGMALAGSLGNSDIKAAPVVEVAAAAPTVDAQILRIKNAHPDAVAVWGGDLFIAKALSALRAAGIAAPLFTSQAGESPAVRSLDKPAVTNGVRFISGRMHSEADACAFPKFENALGTYHLAPVDAHVKDAGGHEVRQPNDIDFFANDAVNVVLAAYQKTGSPKPGAALLDAMTKVSIKSANGDARGFDSQAHEAFAFEDAYIAAMHDNQFQPVKDEALSASLSNEPELMSQFPVPVPTTGCPK